jgi:hypothetical protein
LFTTNTISYGIQIAKGKTVGDRFSYLDKSLPLIFVSIRIKFLANFGFVHIGEWWFNIAANGGV